MSSFTDARFEPLMINGKRAKREGRPLSVCRGHTGDGMWFHIGYLGSGLAVHVREGFITDGISKPTLQAASLLSKAAALFAWVIPQSVIDSAVKSAAVHDLMCEHPAFSRPDADGQFWVAMNAEGVNPFWRDVFFKAVITNKSKEQHNEWNGAEGQGSRGGPDLFDDGGGA